jgi:hypothetical protein
MRDISLIQAGEAKGHGVIVDEQSLYTALEVVPSKIPAFLTHNGALEADRILSQIGYFQGFYILDDRLMAKEFVALDSFKKDEPDRYNRLFDIAHEIPETFGISLVFENELFWITADGKELSAKDNERPAGSKYDMPVVRFVEIYSADFVDEPACNDKGLFNSLKSQQNKKTIMEDTIESSVEENETTDTEATEEAAEKEPTTLEAESMEEVEEETTESDDPEDEEKDEEDTDGEDATLDLISEVAQGLSDLSTKVDALVATTASQGEAVEKLMTLNKLGLLKKVQPKPVQQKEENEESLREKYMKLNGSELIQFTKKNRGRLAQALKTNH